MNKERYELLMVKVADATATPTEREALMSWLAEHPEQRQELEAHLALNALTRGWVDRLDHDLKLDSHLSEPAGQVQRRLGLTLLLASMLLLGGGGMVELWLDPDAPLWVTLSFTLGAAGSAILLFYALRWRRADTDPYSEITR